MERIMRKQPLCELVAEQYTSFEETGEAIVADSLPDLSEVIWTGAQVMIRDKSVQDGSVLISGTIRMCTLSLPEGGGMVQSMEIPITFSQKIRVEGAQSGMLAMCQACVTDAEGKLLSPRKLSVRTVVRVHICLYRECESRVISGIEGDDTIQTLPELLDTCELRFACSKNFTVIEDADVSQADISEILCRRVFIEGEEAAVSQGRINCRATARLVLLYLDSRDSLRICETKLPFTQSLEQPGLEDDMSVQVRCHVRSMELAPSEEAEGDALTVTMGVCADFLITAHAQYSVIRDAYGTMAQLTWEPQPHRYMPWQEAAAQTIDVQESIPLPEVSRVLCADVTQTESVQEEDHRVLTLRADALVTMEDGSLRSVRHSFTAEASAEPACYCAVACTAVPEHGGLRLTAKLAAPEGLPPRQSVDTVGDISVGEPYESGGDPELVLCFDTSDGLWPIAKRCRVTQESIRIANGLSGDQAPGRVLLIPRIH